jgi:HK97 family phage portal protein
LGLLDRWFAGMSASAPGPTDDFWYSPIGGPLTGSGQRVDSESARKLSAWYRGRDILATSVAMLPLQVFERLPNDDGAEVAREHPLYDVLHDAPNSWQDAFTWKRQAMFHLIDHGNAYAFIIAGGRGFADELHPIDPLLVTPEQLPSKRVVYHVRQTNGTTRTYGQDDIFHLCGATDNGFAGKGILQYARESLGLGQATESYAQRLFSQGNLHGGYVTVPGLLNIEAHG